MEKLTRSRGGLLTKKRMMIVEDGYELSFILLRSGGLHGRVPVHALSSSCPDSFRFRASDESL